MTRLWIFALALLALGCASRRPAPNVVVTPAPVTGAPPPAQATPAGACTSTLSVGSVRTRAGCQIDERVSGVYTTIHEFGHQYFQGLLASKEHTEPWLDEGVNSFSNYYVFVKRMLN